MSDLTEQVSVLIPTKNRVSLLNWALAYYAQKCFEGRIIVCDASNNQDEIKSMCTTHKLNLTFVDCRECIHSGDSITKGNESVDTPYAVYAGNDDVSIVEGLRDSVQFLNNNSSEFVAAGGRRATKIKCGGTWHVHYTPFIDLCDNEAWIRLGRYTRFRISLDYTVHRSAVWRKMFSYAPLMKNRGLGGEFLPCCLSAIAGKHAQVTEISVFRLDSGDSLVTSDKTMLLQMLDHDYVDSFHFMKQILIDELVKCGLDHNGIVDFCNRELYLTSLLLLTNKFVEKWPNQKEYLEHYLISLNTYAYSWRRATYKDRKVDIKPVIKDIFNGAPDVVPE
jgi:glycosyltransferase domain-containing protein